jgi:hypothetical protein
VDDKTKAGAQDRTRVSLDDDHEVRYLAQKHGVSADEVRAAVKKVGPMRERVEQELLRGTRATDD